PMPLVAVVHLDLAGGGTAEALLGTALGLQLGHFYIRVEGAPYTGVRRQKQERPRSAEMAKRPLGGCRRSGRCQLSDAEWARAGLAVATAPAMPEAAPHAMGKATAHAMAETVPEFMVSGAVASVIRRIPVTVGRISVT